MNISIIGAGKVGRALGRGWARAGHRIVFGVRDVSKADLSDLCDRIGATAVLSAEAARRGDVVVLALPWANAESAVKALGDLQGKVVIDTMNPLAIMEGERGLDRGYETSAGEAVASWLPNARVVKTFNHVGAEMMAEGRCFATRPVMFLAGDDDDAKATVARMVAELDYEPMDTGPLRRARLLEPLAMIWINQALVRGLGKNWAFAVVRPTG